MNNIFWLYKQGLCHILLDLSLKLFFFVCVFCRVNMRTLLTLLLRSCLWSLTLLVPSTLALIVQHFYCVLG